jgi:ABC-type phosphate transport system ATPase subunit
MVNPGDQNAGRSHIIKTDNSFFERVEKFKYLGTILANQRSIQEEIKKQIEIREFLQSFGAESFVFQFAIQKYKV